MTHDNAELSNYAAHANIELADIIHILDSVESEEELPDELRDAVSQLKVYVDHIHEVTCMD